MPENAHRERRCPRWAFALFLATLVLAIYFRVFSAGYIWDDEAHLTENACIVGPLGFVQIWTTANAVYYPLVLTTFWLVHRFAGLNPLPYHLLNVSLHLLAALLLWRVLKKLNVRGAWLGATLWAVHPVLVQSVAWITEMKNTQSAVFYLLAILFYLDATSRRELFRSYYGLALLCFLAALTSKPSTVILPLVLLLADWWRSERSIASSLKRLFPFVLLSLAASAWTIWEQRFHSGAIGPEWQLNWLTRLLVSSKAVWFYLGRIVWPHPLIFIYPRWQIATSSLISYLPLLGLAAVTVLLFSLRQRWKRPLIFAGAYFVVALLPVMAFFNVYFFRYSFVSDHFQYLASMGPLALAGAGIIFLRDRNFYLACLVSGVLVILLAFLSFQQTAKYHSVFTLYPSILKDNPKCWMADYNLGVALKDDGKPDQAIDYYRAAIAQKSDYIDAYYNLARALLVQGKISEAVQAYQSALIFAPNDAEIRNNYGSALRTMGAVAEAEKQYREAISLAPRNAEAQINLATLLLTSGRAGEAKSELEDARARLPDQPEIAATLGNVLLQGGQVSAATQAFDAALELSPENITALNGLTWLLATTPQVADRDGRRAVILGQRANQLSGGSRPSVLHALAAAYAEAGQFELAVATAKRGISAAESSRNEVLLRAFRDELPLYEIGLPYHQRSRP